jgi:hypothetical protein
MKKFESRPDTANAGANTDALESLLRNARGDGFTRADTEQIWIRLGPVLGARADHPGLNSTTGSLPPQALGALGVKTKVLLRFGGGLVAAGLAAVGITGVALHRAPRAAESRAPAAAAAATGNDSSPLQVIDSAPIGILGGAGGLVALDSPLSTLVQGGLPAAPSLGQTPNPSFPKKTESPARSWVDTRTGITKAAQPAGVDKKTAETSADGPETKETAAPVTQPPPVADQVINEGALLLRARRELASNPTDSLRLTEEHSRAFPTGTLVPESEVLTIEALAQLGRLSEARARFAAFRARYPQSPHLARLEGLIGR